MRGVNRMLLGMVLIGATTQAGCSGRFGRAVRWMDADMGDIHRFPARAMTTGENRFDFIPPDEDRYGPLASPLRFSVDGAEVEQELDDALEERDSYSFIVIRRDTRASASTGASGPGVTRPDR